MAEWTPVIQFLFWFSVGFSIIGVLVLPILIICIPEDYFVRPAGRANPDWHANVLRSVVVPVLRNLVAMPFFAAGIIMLFTPGQGILMLLAALWIASFPGKRALERRLITLPGVRTAVNAIRRKAGKSPLKMP